MLSILPIVVLAQSPRADAARAVFTAKCSQCHGPELKHPKASFGFITDLPRLAANPDYVVPGRPELSDLWKKIADGDMPPDGARAGPLTDDERTAIHDWIASLPAAAPKAPSPAAGEEVGQGATRPEGASTLRRLTTLLGRTHVIILHFPIALILTAAGAEALALARSRPTDPITRPCLTLGAVSAVAAAALGWVHALDGFPGPFSNPTLIVSLHRWLGTAAAALAVLTVILSARPPHRRAARLSLFALALLTAAAAHFGGLLTHGADFLSFEPTP